MRRALILRTENCFWVITSIRFFFFRLEITDFHKRETIWRSEGFLGNCLHGLFLGHFSKTFTAITCDRRQDFCSLCLTSKSTKYSVHSQNGGRLNTTLQQQLDQIQHISSSDLAQLIDDLECQRRSTLLLWSHRILARNEPAGTSGLPANQPTSQSTNKPLHDHHKRSVFLPYSRAQVTEKKEAIARFSSKPSTATQPNTHPTARRERVSCAGNLPSSPASPFLLAFFRVSSSLFSSCSPPRIISTRFVVSSPGHECSSRHRRASPSSLSSIISVNRRASKIYPYVGPCEPSFFSRGSIDLPCWHWCVMYIMCKKAKTKPNFGIHIHWSKYAVSEITDDWL